MSKTRNFVFAAVAILLVTVGAVLVALNWASDDEPADLPKDFALTADDTVSVDMAISDFFSRVGDFGVQYQEDEEEMGNALFSMRNLDPEAVDSVHYRSRAEAYLSVRSLISENSVYYHSDREVSEWTTERDFEMFPNFSIEEARYTVPDKGTYLVSSDGGLSPVVEVQVSLDQRLRTAFISTPEPDAEDGNIFVSKLEVEERVTYNDNVQVRVTLVREGETWKIYEVDAGQYLPALSVQLPDGNAAQAVNLNPTNVRVYDLNFENEVDDHEH